MLGAGSIGVAVKVTLPLVAPAVFNGCLIVFLDTIALFGTPASSACRRISMSQRSSSWNFSSTRAC